jgi:hypothetical protein
VVIATQKFHTGQPSHAGDRHIFEVMTPSLPNGTIVSVASVLAAFSIKKILIGATSAGISYHLSDTYSICMCCWKGATYKSKVHNGNIEIISFAVKFRS